MDNWIKQAVSLMEEREGELVKQLADLREQLQQAKAELGGRQRSGGRKPKGLAAVIQSLQQDESATAVEMSKKTNLSPSNIRKILADHAELFRAASTGKRNRRWALKNKSPV